ncbi:MAG TPA: HD domain-containing protein [Micromonosporaceae bacterium]|nr:HD domain-containing protein [Micromonosporaceae bacterium]
MTDVEATGAMSFIFEAGMLKRAKRAGWWIAGLKDPESIAEHSFRTAIIGTILAAMEGADPARVAMLCVLHDTQETRIGDIPHIGRRYLEAADNNTVTADQVATCPPAVADAITSAVAEYEAATTQEAIVAHDADKLECLVQAVEYRHHGLTTVQPWIDSCRAALKTDSAQRLADAALNGQPLEWLTTYRRQT